MSFAMTRLQNNGKSPTLKIISVGNDLYGDDGIGTAILKKAKEYSAFANTPLIDCATDALSIIDHFQDAEHVLIIDAAKMGEPPGSVKLFDATKAKLLIKTDHLSVHGISLTETMKIAKRIGVYPKTVTIMGIEPEQLSVNRGLSSTVSDAIPTALAKLIEFQSTLHLN